MKNKRIKKLVHKSLHNMLKFMFTTIIRLLFSYFRQSIDFSCCVTIFVVAMIEFFSSVYRKNYLSDWNDSGCVRKRGKNHSRKSINIKLIIIINFFLLNNILSSIIFLLKSYSVRALVFVVFDVLLMWTPL